ncbi:MAG: putative hydroxymethylpyrimidine transporter CytX [candidate division NC10 bacterium]|nr:putative hydroxymethylpyrimidine transporter CytX [candidate division NC10 bacterium]
MEAGAHATGTAAPARPGEWGIAPVPAAERHLGFVDYFVLWGDLGVGLLVLLAGTLLVPALGLAQALLAILIGSLLGSLLLAWVGVIGSDTGVPTMALLRPTLGIRGSYLPTVLNLVQLVGWGTFEIIIMAQAADGITQPLLGVSAFPVWVILVGAFCTLLAVGGPVRVIRQWLETFAVWLMLGTSVWLTAVLVTREDFGAILWAPGKGGLTFWAAVDLVIAMPVSWIPLVADYSRFARSGRGAFWGTAAGYLLANVWFYALGAGLLLALKAQDLIAAIMATAGGWLALGIILVDETDEAFADIYSAAVSSQNLRPALRQRPGALTVGALCTALALTVPLTQYEHFLLLIGSVFVPLFGVLAADYFLLRGRRINPHALQEVGGAYWYQGGFAWRGLTAWGVGIATYHAVGRVLPALGSSLPSFLLAFGARWLLRERPAAATVPARGR